MQRNTKTTIGELRIGDRFIKLDDQKRQVWQKVEHTVKKTKFQTYKHFAKLDIDRFPVAIKAQTEVHFIRHTVPVPGEECLVVDLVEGDIFYKPTLGTEPVHYKMLGMGYEFANVAPIHDTLLIEKAGILAPVVFVKHKD